MNNPTYSSVLNESFLERFSRTISDRPYDFLPALSSDLVAEHFKNYLSNIRHTKHTRITCLQDDEKIHGIAIVHELPWDSSQLGISTGKLDFFTINTESMCTTSLNSTLLARTLEEARQIGIRFLWCKCPQDDIAQAHALEEAGFRFMDHELILAFPGTPTNRSHHKNEAWPIEVIRQREMPQLAPIGNLFSKSRFHADPKIGHVKADQLWRESVLGAVAGHATEVFVAFDENKPIGMISCRDDSLSDDGPRHPVRSLFHVGVIESHQGKGVSHDLLTEVLATATQFDATYVETQSTNIAALALYQAHGFKIVGGRYSFHRHF